MSMQSGLQLWFFQLLIEEPKQLFVRKLAFGRDAAREDLVQYGSHADALWLLMTLVLALRPFG